MLKAIKLRVTLKFEQYVLNTCIEKGVPQNTFNKSLAVLLKHNYALPLVTDKTESYGKTVSLPYDIYYSLCNDSCSLSDEIHKRLNYQIIKPNANDKKSIIVSNSDYNKITDLGDGSSLLGIKVALISAKTFETKYTIDTEKHIYKMLLDIGDGDASLGLKTALGL